jgi:hypothetical protein
MTQGEKAVIERSLLLPVVGVIDLEKEKVQV